MCYYGKNNLNRLVSIIQYAPECIYSDIIYQNSNFMTMKKISILKYRYQLNSGCLSFLDTIFFVHWREIHDQQRKTKFHGGEKMKSS